VVGKFVWHDLMTLDAAAARAFYAELFGWQLVPTEMQGFTVWLIENAGRRIGSIIEEKGVPSSHWMPYLEVADTDEACRRTAALGGHVCMPGMDLPHLGRFAVVDDAQGAFFSLLRRSDGAEPPAKGPGQFVHDTLRTSDPDAAASFYAELAGWQWEKAGEQHWHSGDVSTTRESEHRPAWFPFLGADDVTASTERARSLGARVVLAGRELPYAGPISVLVDPSGAVFGLLKTDSRA
jgi:uncharacterized protein